MRGHGELTPLNDSLNRPKHLFGIDYRVWGLVLLLTIPAILFHQLLLSLFFLVSVVVITRLATLKDPRYFMVLLLSLFQNAHYDPGKR